MTAFRLGTFNALSGRSVFDGQARAHRMADALAELDVQVLALQEVDRCQLRSGGADQTALVAAALGAVDHRFVATVSGTPGVPGWVPAIQPGAHRELATTRADLGLQTATREATAGTVTDITTAGTVTDTSHPAYGIALVSRVPVRSWHILGLRGAPGRYPLLIAGPTPRVRWLPDEPRAAVAAVLTEPALTVACAHLSFVPGRNVGQLRQVVRWLRTLPAPRILLGDLNLPGRLPAWITGWRPLVSGPTYPSPSARLQLDHVLADALPATARRVRASAVRLPVSDHRALTVDLHLPSA